MKTNCLPIELPITVVGTLHLKSGNMYVGDGWMAPFEPALDVALSPGIYEISTQYYDYLGDTRGALLRAVLVGEEFTRGEQMGESWADTATQGFCDLEAMKVIAERMGEDEFAEFIEEGCDQGDAVRLIPDPESEDALFITSSGFGDGVFPVFQLVSGSRVVGIEIEMLAPGTPYPF